MNNRNDNILKSDPNKWVKKVVSVVQVITNSNSIIGEVHNYPALRLLDFLNSANQFIPITNAVVYDLEGVKELRKTPFIVLNKNIINMVMECESSELIYESNKE